MFIILLYKLQKDCKILELPNYYFFYFAKKYVLLWISLFQRETATMIFDEMLERRTILNLWSDISFFPFNRINLLINQERNNIDKAFCFSICCNLYLMPILTKIFQIIFHLVKQSSSSSALSSSHHHQQRIQRFRNV